jgi:RHS repeat-associated protein
MQGQVATRNHRAAEPTPHRAYQDHARYDLEGNLMAEYGGATESAGTYFPVPDHLGSTRLVLNASGAVESRHDYLPFGEEIPGSVGGRSAAGYEIPSFLRQKFTGKERDEAANEAGLDYFLARYYASPQGRFLTPDAPFADQQAADPQSWNLYTYVRNNPQRYVDGDGRAIQLAAAWAVAETLGTAYDVYDAVTTLIDPNASVQEKSLSASGVLLGALLPGAGYGATAKAILKGVDKGADSAKLVRRADRTADAAKLLPDAPTPTKKVHGNTAGEQPAELYKKTDKDGKLQKWGVSKDASKRYTKKQIGGDQVDVIDRGTRREMLDKERKLVETDPGPQNREPWAGKRKETQP